MLPSTKNWRTIERVKEIYVAVFPVPVFGGPAKAETILAGQQLDPNNPSQRRVRATVETYFAAVPDLVALCDKIVEQTKGLESYRLLKFDKDGIHELDPVEFRDIDLFLFGQYRGSAWGTC